MTDEGRTVEALVTPEQAGARVDRVLEAALDGVSRSRVKALIEAGHATVDGRAVTKAGDKLRLGQTLVVHIPPPEPSTAIAQDIPLDVRYEDAHLLVIAKPTGLVVHPARGNPSGTLVNAVLHRCPDLSGIGDAIRPGLVHRLDKDTSGLLVVAKSEAALRSLREQLERRTMARRYLAVVLGGIEADAGTIDTPFGRHPTDRLRFTGRGHHSRRAVTHWQVLARGTIATLLAVRLETGRTHQIRVHLAEAGNPVAGDSLYGRPLSSFGPHRAPREAAALAPLLTQALHAAALAFEHPATGMRVGWVEPPPPPMAEAIARAFPTGAVAVAEWLSATLHELRAGTSPLEPEAHSA